MLHKKITQGSFYHKTKTKAIVSKQIANQIIFDSEDEKYVIIGFDSFLLSHFVFSTMFIFGHVFGRPKSFFLYIYASNPKDSFLFFSQ